MPTVLMVVDSSGERPVLVEGDEVLMPDPGVSWRFVCDVDDRAQGRAVVEQLRQRLGLRAVRDRARRPATTACAF